jgi:hypothetical protein
MCVPHKPACPTELREFFIHNLIKLQGTPESPRSRELKLVWSAHTRGEREAERGIEDSTLKIDDRGKKTLVALAIARALGQSGILSVLLQLTIHT